MFNWMSYGTAEESPVSAVQPLKPLVEIPEEARVWLSSKGVTIRIVNSQACVFTCEEDDNSFALRVCMVWSAVQAKVTRHILQPKCLTEPHATTNEAFVKWLLTKGIMSSFSTDMTNLHFYFPLIRSENSNGEMQQTTSSWSLHTKHMTGLDKGIDVWLLADSMDVSTIPLQLWLEGKEKTVAEDVIG
jgi:hypothetical protein